VNDDASNQKSDRKSGKRKASSSSSDALNNAASQNQVAPKRRKLLESNDEDDEEQPVVLNFPSTSRTGRVISKSKKNEKTFHCINCREPTYVPSDFEQCNRLPDGFSTKWICRLRNDFGLEGPFKCKTDDEYDQEEDEDDQEKIEDESENREILVDDIMHQAAQQQELDEGLTTSSAEGPADSEA